MPEPTPLTTPLGLLLCDDMIFTSRITGTARDLGLVVKTAHSADALLTLARQQTPRCVLVDLSNPGLDIADLIRSLGEACSPPPWVAAYGSHVDTATLRAAREAGCNVVWPRSKFVEELPRALPDWFSSTLPGSS
jgi:CheY-like chemotaxis protein